LDDLEQPRPSRRAGYCFLAQKCNFIKLCVIFCAILARLWRNLYNNIMFNPQYKISNKIINLLTYIAEAKSVIDRAKLLPQNELRLRRQALIRMTHSSTAIEGNMLSKKLLKGLKVYSAFSYQKTAIIGKANFKDSSISDREYFTKRAIRAFSFRPNLCCASTL